MSNLYLAGNRIAPLGVATPFGHLQIVYGGALAPGGSEGGDTGGDGRSGDGGEGGAGVGVAYRGRTRAGKRRSKARWTVEAKDNQ